MADNYIEKRYEQYQAMKASMMRPQCKNTHKTETVEFNKRVLVTGGAHGIGKSIVKHFCKKGCKVAFCDIDKKSGLTTSKETGAAFFYVDVKQEKELIDCIHKLLTRWGDLDIIINNVGIQKTIPITDCPLELFDEILSVNLRPAFITAQQLARHRKSLDNPNMYGRIINICSTYYLMSEPGNEAYAASKGGIFSLTHALAASLSLYHITVNSITPGWIHTNEMEVNHQHFFSEREGTPDDIARTCFFLCQKENDFINGENITIDGGMTKKIFNTK